MPLTGKGTAIGSGLRKAGLASPMRLFVILATLSLSLFAVDCRQGEGGVLRVIRSGFQTLTMPVRYVGMVLSAPFSAMGNVAANLTASQETLTDLQAEIAELRAENARLTEDSQMVERLEGLLQLRSTYNLKSTGARIISGSLDSWASTVMIDKGITSGITVGMPVADAHGAIGQVIETSATSAVVRLITDENSGISAMVQQTRAQGQLCGSTNGTLRLTLIRSDQNVSVGDVVVTSGIGGVFPKGLPLGKVASVEKATGALYYDIVVEPLAPIESFEEVLVITSLTEDQQATAEDIAEADLQETATGVGDGEGRSTSQGEDDGDGDVPAEEGG